MNHDCRLIAADDQAVSRTLFDLVGTVKKGGGVIRSDIRFVAQDGQFCVYCDRARGQAEQLLFHLPREALVPFDGIEWAAREDLLRVCSPLGHLTPFQQDLLAFHVELYNLSRKIPWAVRNLPTIALRAHRPLVSAIEAVFPGFADSSTVVSDAFFQSRLLSTQGKKVLMPLVDLMNHHAEGAALQTDASGMRVVVAQPGIDDECFSCYGDRRDVLDLALHYGYVDRHTPFASCAPLNCELPGLGHLRIHGRRRRVLHPLDPPEVGFDEGGMTLSHLTCDRRHPERLQSVLKLALLGMARKRGVVGGKAEEAWRHAVEAICAANLGLLLDVRQAAEPLAAGLPAAELVIQAAAVQADIFRDVLSVDRRTGTRL